MNIKSIRTQRSLSQKELAFAINTNPNNISRYETGEREPNIATLKAIAKALECTIDELLEEPKEATE